MPIHLSILQPRLAEGGKIKIGGLGAERIAKSGRKVRNPERYDHFVITKTVRDESGVNFAIDQPLMDEIMKDPQTWIPGKDKDGRNQKKLIRIPVLFDSDLIEEIYPTRLAAYWGTRLFCSGTGPDAPARRAVYKRNGNTHQRTGFKEMKCPCDLLVQERNGIRCKPNGILWATIAAGRLTTLGIRHSFRTTSWNSIRYTLASLVNLRNRIGTLVNVPCWLVLREEKIKDQNGVTRKIHVVHVELRISDLADLRKLQRDALEAAQLRRQVMSVAARPEVLGLPAPASPKESAAEQARVAQEYYPDSEEQEREDSADETIDYDPNTGEVYDQGADVQPELPPDQDTKADPADPIGTTAREHAVPWDPPEDPFVPTEDPIRTRITSLITDLARARDFSDEDLDKGQKEIWREVALAARDHFHDGSLGWQTLLPKHAEWIEGHLVKALEASKGGGDEL